MAKPIIKQRAKIEILNYIVCFCTKDSFDKNGLAPFQMDCAFITDRNPPVGSLVKIMAAPFTKWYLGWYREYIPATKESWERHLIESIEDGSLCTWYNVSLAYLPTAKTEANLHWRWTDQQFAFKDRLMKAHRKSENTYIFRIWPKFTETGVEIPLRRRVYGSNEPEEVRHTIILDNRQWKKATLKALTGLLNMHIKRELKNKIK